MNSVSTKKAMQALVRSGRRHAWIAVGLLVLCSCRGPQAPATASMGYGPSGPAASDPPRRAMLAGGPQAAAIQQVAAEEPIADPANPQGVANPAAPGGYGVPLPQQAPAGPWAPPGIRQPWPGDEYIADGGDAGAPAGVSVRDGHLTGVGPEDTVAQYDTLDGRTLVEASNRVHIYSPRFRSVRQVVGISEAGRLDRVGGTHQPERVAGNRDSSFAAGCKQNEQLFGRVGQRSLTAVRTKQNDGHLSASLALNAFHDGFKPYENFETIRLGRFQAKERALLIRGTTAAKAWEHKDSVQVILDHLVASSVTRNEQVQNVYAVKEPPANPKLQITKVASTQFAEPGETVDFTIRFDNVGNQTIGNVVIVDNLTTRLEYVPDSAQASVPAEFSSQVNEGQSLVLRWEIRKPLKVGEGGIVRFTCRVR